MAFSSEPLVTASRRQPALSTTHIIGTCSVTSAQAHAKCYSTLGERTESARALADDAAREQVQHVQIAQHSHRFCFRAPAMIPNNTAGGGARSSSMIWNTMLSCTYLSTASKQLLSKAQFAHNAPVACFVGLDRFLAVCHVPLGQNHVADLFGALQELLPIAARAEKRSCECLAHLELLIPHASLQVVVQIVFRLA